MIMIRCVISFPPHYMDIINPRAIKPQLIIIPGRWVSSWCQLTQSSAKHHERCHPLLYPPEPGCLWWPDSQCQAEETDRNTWVSLSNFPNVTCAHKAGGLILEADAQPGLPPSDRVSTCLSAQLNSKTESLRFGERKWLENKLSVRFPEWYQPNYARISEATKRLGWQEDFSYRCTQICSSTVAFHSCL